MITITLIRIISTEIRQDQYGYVRSSQWAVDIAVGEGRMCYGMRGIKFQHFVDVKDFAEASHTCTHSCNNRWLLLALRRLLTLFYKENGRSCPCA
jgi:hypothetical protein